MEVIAIENSKNHIAHIPDVVFVPKLSPVNASATGDVNLPQNHIGTDFVEALT